jgi:hypothetical protein
VFVLISSRENGWSDDAFCLMGIGMWMEGGGGEPFMQPSDGFGERMTGGSNAREDSMALDGMKGSKQRDRKDMSYWCTPS